MTFIRFKHPQGIHLYKDPNGLKIFATTVNDTAVIRRVSDVAETNRTTTLHVSAKTQEAEPTKSATDNVDLHASM